MWGRDADWMSSRGANVPMEASAPDHALSLLKSKLPRPRPRLEAGPDALLLEPASIGKQPLVRTHSLPKGFFLPPNTGSGHTLPPRRLPSLAGGEAAAEVHTPSPLEPTRRALKFDPNSPLALAQPPIELAAAAPPAPPHYSDNYENPPQRAAGQASSRQVRTARRPRGAPLATCWGCPCGTA